MSDPVPSLPSLLSWACPLHFNDTELSGLILENCSNIGIIYHVSSNFFLNVKIWCLVRHLPIIVHNTHVYILTWPWLCIYNKKSENFKKPNKTHKIKIPIKPSAHPGKGQTGLGFYWVTPRDRPRPGPGFQSQPGAGIRREPGLAGSQD